MNAITAAWSALANFARALNRLAAAADAVAEHVEDRVALVGPVAAAGIEVDAEVKPSRRKAVVNGQA